MASKGFCIVLLVLGAAISVFGSNIHADKPGLKYIGSIQKSKTSGEIGIASTGAETVYYMSEAPSTWINARSFCEDAGMKLVDFDTAEEELEILKFWRDNSQETLIWSSGRYEPGYNAWIWDSSLAGTFMFYTNWKTTPSLISLMRVRVQRIGASSLWETISMSTRYNFICEFGPERVVPDPCFKSKDLIIVLDGSGSIGIDNFESTKQKVADLASAFTIPSFESRISFIVYGTQSTTLIQLNSGLTREQINDAILKANYPGTSTRTDLGINAAVSQLQASRGVPRVIVVLTDGYSDSAASTTVAAQDATAQGITTFAVGIGGYNLAELVTIAGNVQTRVYETANFDDLIRVIVPLGRSICAA